jgi:hypothetical protein
MGDRVPHIDLAGRDPDDGCTWSPYEKGALLAAPSTLSGARFEVFLRSYFQRFAFAHHHGRVLDYLR